MSQVRAKHILLKSTRSRNPTDSYRNVSVRQRPITRSFEEAMSGIVAIRLQLEQGAEFDEIARNISECRSAAKGGDLGYFSRGQMQKSFEDATFALSVGELSQPVVSDSGVHLIMRTA